jgi:Protein of unknown function (DUF2612)
MFSIAPISETPFATLPTYELPPVPTQTVKLWQETILSQYDSSPTLLALIESFNDAIDVTGDIANFYSDIWNVATAIGYGLDVWGQIVGVSRYLQVGASNYLGFDEAYTAPTASTGAQPFGQAPFGNGVASTTTFALPDEQYRRLILVKAAANISNLSVPAINNLLRMEFGTSDGINPYGSAYVIDNNNMTFNYYLDFVPSAVQIAIINNSGVFPRPAGVSVTLTYL